MDEVWNIILLEAKRDILALIATGIFLWLVSKIARVIELGIELTILNRLKRNKPDADKKDKD